MLAFTPLCRSLVSRAAALHAGFLAIVVASVVGPSAPAASFVVVRSGEEAPYKAATARIVERIQSTGGTIAEYTLESWNASVNPDVTTVIAVGTEAAQRANKDAPAGTAIVFCMVADPNAAGLLDSGRPVRGVTMEPAPAEQLALIRRAIPKARSVGVLYSSASPASVTLLEQARSATPTGLVLEAVDVASYANASAAIDALVAKSPDCIWTRPDPAVYDSAVVRAVLLTGLRQSTPVFGYSAAVVRAGALIGVAVSPEDQGETAAMMALDKTSDDRTMAPARWDSAVNIEVADRLGVSLPPDVLKGAKVVFRKP